MEEKKTLKQQKESKLLIADNDGDNSVISTSCPGWHQSSAFTSKIQFWVSLSLNLDWSVAMAIPWDAR